MNYIYDISLNFNTTLYEFYEWNATDDIKYIKKIPVIKINEKDLFNLMNYKIRIDQNIMLKIKNKTIPSNINGCIFTNNFKSLALLFNDEGISIKKSFLLLDEEAIVLRMLKKTKEEEIKYEKLKKEKINKETRNEQELKQYLVINLNKIKDNQAMLEYIYYECFDEKEKSKIKIIKRILDNINNSTINKKIINIFKLLEFDKKKYVC